MRIKEAQHNAIINCAEQVFGTGSFVYLFGSRVDDRKKGGDIDLLIKPGLNSGSIDMFNKKIQFLVLLKKEIGQRKIDVLIDIAGDQKKSIIEEVYKTGIKL